MSRLRVALAVAALAVVLPAGAPLALAEPPDRASDPTPSPRPATELRLTIAQGEAGTEPRRIVTLRCAPVGGDHPRAEDACEHLRRASGVLARLPGDPSVQFCVQIYEPVTVTAQGTWRSRQVSYQETFSNSCVLKGATGPVFAF